MTRDRMVLEQQPELARIEAEVEEDFGPVEQQVEFFKTENKRRREIVIAIAIVIVIVTVVVIVSEGRRRIAKVF